MKKTAAGLALLMGVCVGSAASAESRNGERFEGFYGGLELGVARENGLKEDEWFDANRTNFYYGGVIGYREQFKSGLVLGIEGSLGDTGYKNKVRPIECDDCVFPDVVGGDNEWEADYKTSYHAGLGLIVGTVLGREGNNLLYLNTGIVKANNSSRIISETVDPVKLYNDTGWKIGAGYEWAMNQNMSLRLSADYIDFGSVNTDKVDGLTARQAHGTSQLQTKVGLIFSF